MMSKNQESVVRKGSCRVKRNSELSQEQNWGDFSSVLSTQTTNTNTSLTQREFYVSKIRKQRQKIQKLLQKFDQQKQQNVDLQNYIEQLQKRSSQKDQQIEELNKKLYSSTFLMSYTDDSVKQEYLKTIQILKEDINTLQIQRKKQQKQQRILKARFEDERDLMLEQIQQIKSKNEENLREIQKQNEQTDKNKIQTIFQMQTQIDSLKQQVSDLRKVIDFYKTDNQSLVLKQRQDFQNLQRVPLKNKCINSQQNENQVWDKQMEKWRLQYKKIKKQNFNLKHSLEQKQFEVQNLKREKNRLKQQNLRLSQQSRSQNFQNEHNKMILEREKQNCQLKFSKLSQQFCSLQLTSQNTIKKNERAVQQNKKGWSQKLRQAQIQQLNKIAQIFDHLTVQK